MEPTPVQQVKVPGVIDKVVEEVEEENLDDMDMDSE